MPVWELPVDRILAGGIATLPLAPVSTVTPADLPGVIDRMRERLDREVSPPEAADLWQTTAISMRLRYDKPFIKATLAGVFGMTESVIYQEIVAKGEAQGEAKGAAKDKVEGERAMLVRRATRRFGPAPAAALARLVAVNDTAELERLDDVLDGAASWDDWLGR